ncbi:MAG: hypothetical protein B6D39_00625 [Anaerolineae bacterium UTCFX2]|nr:MAG: hypothetical protein B6D39_00625 [Anaerolineae bacterium UTCFX2]
MSKKSRSPHPAKAPILRRPTRLIQSLQRSLQGEARGQALVLLAVSFFALLAFIGLVTDVGSIYVSYTQLQRAIDAAAVAAANNIKFPQATYEERKTKITESARELLDLNDITGVDDLEAYLCDDAGAPASFQALCPSSGQPARKLVYIQATQQVPVFFLQIFGVRSVPITASAVGETSAVDLVLVFDTSESMGVNTVGYNPGDFRPNAAITGCNITRTCQPLEQAKAAAQSLVANLFPGYDQVAIVTFSYRAQVIQPLSDELGTGGVVRTAVDGINLHDDAPAALVKWYRESPWGGYRPFNPIWPDDRDGNGMDADPGMPCVDEFVNNADGTLGDPVPDMWDDDTGDACDRDDELDAFDWNRDGYWGTCPNTAYCPETLGGGDNIDPLSNTFEDTSLVSTCSGCGLRVATDVLRATGRRNSTWVIVFLSDGVANLSDDHDSFNLIDAGFRYGFCGKNPNTSFWSSYCIDRNAAGSFSEGRFCIDNTAAECPPSSTHTTESGPYSVEDYAFDMVDRAALLFSENEHEPTGEDIVIFSIGLGAASGGENLLRYMANVGDEGSRANDPCAGVPALQNCGNYYYAPNASYLSQIFENIAGRIFTKISR